MVPQLGVAIIVDLSLANIASDDPEPPQIKPNLLDIIDILQLLPSIIDVSEDIMTVPQLLLVQILDPLDATILISADPITDDAVDVIDDIIVDEFAQTKQLQKPPIIDARFDL